MLIRKKLCILPVLALSLFSTFQSAFSFEEKLLEQDRSSWGPNDYWEETQLNFKSLVYGVVSDANCKNSVKKFVACVAVMNKIYDLENPKNSETIGINFNGDNEFVKTNTSETRPQQYLIDLNNSLNENFDDDSIKLVGTSFSSQMEKFETDFVTVNNDSATAATIYNTYLTVAKDPHSYIMPLKRMQDQSRPSTKSKGIGVYFQIKIVKGVEKALITEVIEGSPSERAGVLAGDVFLRINAKDNFSDMLKEIGDVDILSTTILRDDKVVTLSMIKGHYTVKNVTVKMIKRAQGNFGYIKLRNFSDSHACFKISYEISKLKEDKNFKGLILDLRNNGGGLKTQATCIMEQFLEPGSRNWMEKILGDNTLVYDSIRRYKKRSGVQDYHSVVLINGYSASASEALSMYLQDYEKAFIVGERSFGKGSVQSVGEFPNKDYGEESRGIVRAQTQFLYYGPKGISPQLRGVTPDIVAYPKMDQREATEFMRETDLYAFPIPDREVNVDELVRPTRIRQVDIVKNCLHDSSRIKSDYSKLSKTNKSLFDNQLETGIETITCANKEIKVTRKITLNQTNDLEMLSQAELRARRMRNMVNPFVFPGSLNPEFMKPELPEFPELEIPAIVKPESQFGDGNLDESDDDSENE